MESSKVTTVSSPIRCKRTRSGVSLNALRNALPTTAASSAAPHTSSASSLQRSGAQGRVPGGPACPAQAQQTAQDAASLLGFAALYGAPAKAPPALVVESENDPLALAASPLKRRKFMMMAHRGASPSRGSSEWSTSSDDDNDNELDYLGHSRAVSAQGAAAQVRPGPASFVPSDDPALFGVSPNAASARTGRDARHAKSGLFRGPPAPLRDGIDLLPGASVPKCTVSDVTALLTKRERKNARKLYRKHMRKIRRRNHAVSSACKAAAAAAQATAATAAASASASASAAASASALTVESEANVGPKTSTRTRKRSHARMAAAIDSSSSDDDDDDNDTAAAGAAKSTAEGSAEGTAQGTAKSTAAVPSVDPEAVLKRAKGLLGAAKRVAVGVPAGGSGITAAGAAAMALPPPPLPSSDMATFTGSVANEPPMLFTLSQVTDLMDRVLAEHDYKLRAEYSELAHQRIQERFQFLSEFNREMHINRYASTPASYIG